MQPKIHHLIIRPSSAKTACGLHIVAYYPLSGAASTGEAGKEPIRVNVGVKNISCEECKRKMKVVDV